MKLLKKQISAKDGSGTVLLRPETVEDLWHAYNLVQHTDSVRCTTVRKVVHESYATGSTTSNKKRIMLTVAVDKIELDADVWHVRVSGTVQTANEHVRMGAHHTLTLELHQNFSIEKQCWDQIYLNILQEACHPEKQAEIAAIVMQSSGLAHVCLITGALTITKARIETTIPKKRSLSTNHAKATIKFYEAVYQAVLRHVDFTTVKCVILGSPGFVKNDFFTYLQEQAVRRDDKILIQNKSKFVLCHATSGHKHALEDVFTNPDIMAQMTDTQVAQEVTILDKFMRLMSTDPDRAYYGYKHVCAAHEQLAIDSLLVTDELFRNSRDVKTRKMYVALVESVQAAGGRVYIFSSMHVSGQQLQQVSGVAAILRYPLPDLEALEEQVAAAGVDNPSDDDEEEEEYDPDRRIREDMRDMGLGE